jgi:hypothetical protein
MPLGDPVVLQASLRPIARPWLQLRNALDMQDEKLPSEVQLHPLDAFTPLLAGKEEVKKWND